MPVGSLRQKMASAQPTNKGTVVVVRGVITADPVPAAVGQGAIAYLQDLSGGIRLFSAEPFVLDGLHQGDVVEVAGTAQVSSGDAEVQVGRVVRLTAAQVPEPVQVQAAELRSGSYAGRLVELSGELTALRLKDKAVFLIRDSSGDAPVQFRSQTLLDPSFLSRVSDGGHVRIIGIAEEACTGSKPCRPQTVLTPRGQQDVIFTFGPTRKQVASGVAISLSLMVMVWLWSQRRAAKAEVRHREYVERVERHRSDVLSMVARNMPLSGTLAHLLTAQEKQGTDLRCAILLIAEGGTLQLFCPDGQHELSSLNEMKPDLGSRALFQAASDLHPVFLDDLEAGLQQISRITAKYGEYPQRCWCGPIVTAPAQLHGFLLAFVAGARQKLTAGEESALKVAVEVAAIACQHTHLTSQLAHQAQHDPLTGLPNRVLLKDRIQQAINYSDRHDDSLAVLAIDLDNFKPINDTVGHAAGDQVLKEVALRLSRAVRSTDTVARVGGDEFTVVMTEVKEPGAVMDLAERCLAAVSAPGIVHGREVALSASIGVVLYPEDGSEPETLQHNADAAMYVAKESGKSSIKLFQPEMAARRDARLGMINALQHALERGEFVLHYQPQCHADGSIVGFEALLRWNHPTEGLLLPGRFIDLAEESGLIVPIGGWVLREACRRLAIWHNEGARVTMAVNVSALQFDQASFVEQVGTVLKETAAPANYLQLELTERSVLTDLRDAARKIAELSALGVSCAIDDFGTGYASLRYLQELAVNAIKIDRCFVKECTDAGGARSIVEVIMSLAHGFGLQVVAEGVETQAQLQVVRALGCEVVQGYLFFRPMPEQACEGLLRSPAGDPTAVQAEAEEFKAAGSTVLAAPYGDGSLAARDEALQA